MKFPALFLLAAVGIAPASAGSPVSQVVELLRGLAETVEKELEKEESLYETYNCWAKGVIEAKTASNDKATSRKEYLEGYISDLESGKIELTSERADLEKEIKDLTAEIEAADALRSQEADDFAAAKDEMEKAIEALESAIDVLKDAGKGKTESLVALRGGSEETFSARAGEREALARAVEIGTNVLSKGDALFLQRLLEGDVPKRDHKKLNRKATFKQKYQQRSGDILSVLRRLLKTFKANLEEAQEKEDDAVALHEKLNGGKRSQRDKANDALSKMEVEGSARQLSKTEAQDEVDDLKVQITADEGFIADTKASKKKKDEEWEAREKVRRDEIGAINEAISILHSDDARDTFTKSYKSQGFEFLQTGERRRAGEASGRAQGAASALRLAGRTSHDARLLGLAKLLEQSPDHFKDVIKAIDDMLDTLATEEGSDLKRKEACENTHVEDTRKALLASREMDEQTDKITRLREEISEIEAEIKEKEEEVVRIEEQVNASRKIRAEEHADWVVSDKDDEEASKLVAKAKKVLQDFYQPSLMQQVRRHEQPEVAAGKAPPPPPSTWSGEAKVKKEASNGILAILTMIKDDIDKDRLKAKKAEDSAKTDFEKLESDSETEIGALEESVNTLTGTKSDKESKVSDTLGERNTKKGELEVVMKKIKDAAPGCDFFNVNFDVRYKNRQIEIDGLHEARAILQGAKFDKGPDEGRALKPGDAL